MIFFERGMHMTRKQRIDDLQFHINSAINATIINYCAKHNCAVPDYPALDTEALTALSGKMAKIVYAALAERLDETPDNYYFLIDD